jgi:hypothetical protein
MLAQFAVSASALELYFDTLLRLLLLVVSCLFYGGFEAGVISEGLSYV